jgi:hypothetical protein
VRSGDNFLFHVARLLRPRALLGFEASGVIAERTRHNFSRIGFSARIAVQPFPSSPEGHGPRPNVIIVDPPWADGFRFNEGLDLRRTVPHVGEILATAHHYMNEGGGLCIVKTHPAVVAESMEEIRQAFTVVDEWPSGGCGEVPFPGHFATYFPPRQSNWKKPGSWIRHLPR